MKKLIVFIVVIWMQVQLFAQVIPVPGAKLNYTQIMFEHPQVMRASQYLLQVSLADDSLLFKHPVASQKDSSLAMMINNLEFGKKYTWRYTGLLNGKELGWNGPYNFETLTDDAVDTSLFRVRVLQNDSQLASGGLITLDVAHNIFDRQGKCVWFLPQDSVDRMINGHLSAAVVNDLQVTPIGTVVLINSPGAEERDLNARIIWQAPAAIADSSNPASVYGYNHCLKKLQNGNYMVICWASSFLSLGGKMGGNAAADTSKTPYTYEVLKEFDKKNNLVWAWSSDTYINGAELKSLALSKPETGLINTLPGGHMNAFDVDEKNGFVYAGFRNLNRVVKIDKKTGKVIYAWGAGMHYGGADNAAGFFSRQHEVRLLRDGSVAIFNNGANRNNNRTNINNVHNKPSGQGAVGILPGRPANTGPGNGKHMQETSPPSSVVIFNEPADTLHSQMIWKFDCLFDSMGGASARGGGVDELKNGNLLVCMGTINRVFEVTRSKKIVWNAVIETKAGSVWQPLFLYRAHYTSSLYPCYFTVQASADTLTKEVASFQLRIFNDGTEDDMYQVSASSVTGSYKKQFSTPVLHSRKSVSIEMSPDKLPAGDDKIKVTVQSVTNAAFKRTVYVQYIR